MAKSSKGKLSRRALLAGTAGAIGAKLLPAQDPAQDATKDPTKVQGDLAKELGERSRFEEPRRTFFSSSRSASNTPLQDLEASSRRLIYISSATTRASPKSIRTATRFSSTAWWRDRERSRSRT